MASVLADFLDGQARRRWQWGNSDCLMLVADWVLAARGMDPGAPWRGCYSTELGAAKVLMSGGGIERVLHGALQACGIDRTKDPQAGDVALVSAPVKRVGRCVVNATTGAIIVSTRLRAVMTERGLVISDRLPLVTAWKIHA